MPVQDIYKLDKIVFPGTSKEIHTLGNVSTKFGIKSQMGQAAGQIFHNFVATERQQPSVEFTTKAIDALFGIITPGGTASSSPITYYLKRASAIGYQARTATVHKKAVMNNWLGYWTSLKLSHNGQAELSVSIQANYDGTNDPIIVTGSIALAGNLLDTNYFGLGPSYINTVAITGVQEITIQNQVKLIQAGSDSEEFDTFTGIETIGVEATIKTFQPVNWETFNLRGLALAGSSSSTASGFVCFARKYLKNGSRVANATAEHISFAIPQGRVIPVDESGNESQPISDTAKVEGVVVPIGTTYTDASLPLTVATGVVIAAPSV